MRCMLGRQLAKAKLYHNAWLGRGQRSVRKFVYLVQHDVELSVEHLLSPHSDVLLAVCAAIPHRLHTPVCVSGLARSRLNYPRTAQPWPIPMHAHRVSTLVAPHRQARRAG